MAGKRSPARHLRLATNAQLWVLNRASKLKLVENKELEPITNAQADAAIQRSMAAESDASSDDSPQQ